MPNNPFNPLTPRQQRFVEEYMIDLNASAAAVRAGYSPKTARFIGHENLTKPNIQSAVSSARSQLAKRSEVSLDWVISQYMKIASANPFDYLQFHPDGTVTPKRAEILRDLGTAIVEYSEDEELVESVELGQVRRVRLHIKIRLANRMAALLALGRYLGMFNGNAAPDDSQVPYPRVQVVTNTGNEGEQVLDEPSPVIYET